MRLRTPLRRIVLWSCGACGVQSSKICHGNSPNGPLRTIVGKCAKRRSRLSGTCRRKRTCQSSSRSGKDSGQSRRIGMGSAHSISPGAYACMPIRRQGLYWPNFWVDENAGNEGRAFLAEIVGDDLGPNIEAWLNWYNRRKGQ
jgi:hypothetical protein